jgi:hypothetical protein
VIDELARPRVGIVVSGGEDAWVVAVAARILTLAVLDRVPRARVSVLVSGGGVPAGWALDCGRPARRLEAEDRQRFDVLLVAGAGTKVSGRGGAGACPVVRMPGSVVDVGMLAARAGGVELRRNRVGTLRLLGWLPGDAGTPHVVVDADADVAGSELRAPLVAVVPELTGGADAMRARLGAERCLVLPLDAGVDEVVAALASAARYVGSHPVLAAIAAGVRDAEGSAAISSDAAAVEKAQSAAEVEQAESAAEVKTQGAAAREIPAAATTSPAAAGTSSTTASAAIDSAAAAAVDCWAGRGSPGAVPDPRPARRTATQHAALRVELRALEQEQQAAIARAEQAETAASLITGSRTWRYTERVRDAYHKGRRRLGR